MLTNYVIVLKSQSVKMCDCIIEGKNSDFWEMFSLKVLDICLTYYYKAWHRIIDNRGFQVLGFC